MFPSTDSPKNAVDMFPRTDIHKWHSFCPLNPRRVYSVDTTSYYVEILNFRYFYRHCVFVKRDGFERKKVVKDYINVSVVINLVWVDTRNSLFRQSREFDSTIGGGGTGYIEKTIKRLCTQANVLTIFAGYDSSIKECDLEQWLQKNGLLVGWLFWEKYGNCLLFLQRFW